MIHWLTTGAMAFMSSFVLRLALWLFAKLKGLGDGWCVSGVPVGTRDVIRLPFRDSGVIHRGAVEAFGRHAQIAAQRVQGQMQARPHGLGRGCCNETADMHIHVMNVRSGRSTSCVSACSRLLYFHMVH